MCARRWSAPCTRNTRDCIRNYKVSLYDARLKGRYTSESSCRGIASWSRHEHRLSLFISDREGLELLSIELWQTIDRLRKKVCGCMLRFIPAFIYVRVLNAIVCREVYHRNATLNERGSKGKRSRMRHREKGDIRGRDNGIRIRSRQTNITYAGKCRIYL
jgi:hypothetical protein